MNCTRTTTRGGLTDKTLTKHPLLGSAYRSEVSAKDGHDYADGAHDHAET
jgi:hypothetical protein